MLLYRSNNTIFSLFFCSSDKNIAGLTQKELADVRGKNESTIRNYELGNRYPDDDILFEIANALEISPYALSTPKANVAPSALQFLFNCGKTLELTPTMIDGKAYLEVSSDIDVDDVTIPPLENVKRIIAHWASIIFVYRLNLSCHYMTVY